LVLGGGAVVSLGAFTRVLEVTICSKVVWVVEEGAAVVEGLAAIIAGMNFPTAIMEDGM
jgi:hypothetical protein